MNDLREKHGTNFIVEQFSMWVHIIHSTLHVKPLICHSFNKVTRKTTAAPSSASTPRPLHWQYLASSLGTLIFSMHARKKGEPGI